MEKSLLGFCSIKLTMLFCAFFDRMCLKFNPATLMLLVCGTDLQVALALMKKVERCGPAEKSLGWTLWRTVLTF